MKQITLREFMSIAKKKDIEKKKEEEVEDAFSDWAKDPGDNSRPATLRETFYKFCHMKEFIHQAIKENDQKWIAMRIIDNNRMDAILKLNKSQDNRIKVWRKSLKTIPKVTLMKSPKYKNI